MNATTDTNRAPGVPEGYGSVSPWIISRDTGALITFATEAFDAIEIARVVDEKGVIGHAEFRIGDTVVLAFDALPDWPKTPAFLGLYVEDADGAFKRAIEAGAKAVTDVTHLPWGDRVGRVRDPLGNLWWIQARIEEVGEDEMMARMQEPNWQERMAYVQSSIAFPTDEARARSCRDPGGAPGSRICGGAKVRSRGSSP